jgi:phosphoribosylaminoimidazole-succinocarboxamide synthase
MVKAFSEVSIPELPLFKKGKVRDVYELEDKLLIIASDRISAFDYVLPSDFTSLVCPNHLLTDKIDEFPPVLLKYKEILDKRSMLVHKTEVIPVECVVRGYLSGSGWKDYKATGKISGVKVPSGLKEADRLDDIIFTPATKAEGGEHDLNISFKEMQKLVEPELAHKIKKISVELFQKASFHALSKGIIIADTKFEFGLLKDELILIDEIFTPDSSRFWPLASYSPGQSPPSLDKQFVRNYLESTDWDKESPPPPLPQSIIEQTSKRYLEIYSLLTGKNEL